MVKGVILINNAIFSPVFKRLAIELKNKGVDITIVTDSEFSIRKYKLHETKCNIISFEEFSNIKNTDVESQAQRQYDKWNVHADYDRDNYYHSVNSKDDNFWGTVSSDLYRFFEHVFRNDMFNFVFYENVSNGLAYTANRVAEKYGVRYLGLTASRLPGKSLFSTLDDQLSREISSLIDNLPELSVDKYSEIKNYIDNIQNIQPDYMKNNGLSSVNFISKIFKKRDFTFITETIRQTLVGKNDLFQVGNPLLKSFYMNFREVKRWFCVKRIKKLFSEDLTSQPFYLYPLHYHPESSTSILAKFYDEYNLIRNLSFSLPHGKFLVVKDHISATGYEGYEFYKKILKLPNVKLANPNLNSKELIKKSLGVFTLTSTVGYEAVLMNKPVAVFGDVFYMGHPLVYQCRGYKDIHNALSHMQENQTANYYDYNIKFVGAYDYLCFPLTISYGSSSGAEFIEAISTQILRNLKDR
ncbi:TPA: hypothetical protein U2I11_001915 [Citrobacter koseri]|uniref:Capsule polysaccharide biosynthesis protein n=5 Tax=Citrobacter koseri TaxID=545 RepID=A0AAQ0V7S4_CITKO|nr:MULTISPECIES: hypothetical protein [Citrobacter]OFV18244.1 hypothetical protein HMPREF3126_02840 [Salmonella sp. HMSC13B08]ASE84075.1 hypothetical protein CEP66_16635 [Citrobacter koseri]ATF98039.1 hypothetical protein CO700_13810 [Citrobacter koseri]AVE69259.1 hypothetical protein AM351_16310 [Citrobacter koseri]EJK7981888.1 hypothetical protein [Citrobacter koseri]